MSLLVSFCGGPVMTRRLVQMALCFDFSASTLTIAVKRTLYTHAVGGDLSFGLVGTTMAR